MWATILTTREAAFYHLIAIVRRGGPSDQEAPYVPLLCELAEIPPDQRTYYNALPFLTFRDVQDLMGLGPCPLERYRNAFEREAFKSPEAVQILQSELAEMTGDPIARTGVLDTSTRMAIELRFIGREGDTFWRARYGAEKGQEFPHPGPWVANDGGRCALRYARQHVKQECRDNVRKSKRSGRRQDPRQEENFCGGNGMAKPVKMERNRRRVWSPGAVGDLVSELLQFAENRRSHGVS
jgi:hypothetical protein